MTLESEIKKHAAVVSTQSYSMSVGELISMYRDRELDLHPDFQRFFRWTDEQKSRLLESILLGIPIPPVFVSEQGDSTWEVVDGLQRLSTILEICGELRDERDTARPALQLSKTRYLPSLKGATWDGLPEAVRIRVKRARLDVNILKSTSDKEAKYEVFQRLNTGGTPATDQEVRNCLLLMVDRTFYEWMRDLAQDNNFRNCIPLTDKAIEESYDLELVARYVVLSHSSLDELKNISELGAFLTEQCLHLAKGKSFDRDAVGSSFSKVFSFLADQLGMDSFRRFDRKTKKYAGAMLISLFEVVAVGLGHRVLHRKKLPEAATFGTAHKKLWYDKTLSGHVGPGVRASTRIPTTIALGRGWPR